MPAKNQARTPEGEIIELPAYQVALIEKINALPPHHRAHMAGSIADFCFAAAEGLRAGGQCERSAA